MNVIDHPFENAGLGKAPFRLIGMYSIPSPALAEVNPAAYQAELAAMPRDCGIGSCAFCGMPLTHNFIIQSADKRRFSVGCDCVDKTGDAKLMSAAEKVELDRKRAIAAAKAAAKRAAQAAAYEAEMAAQRDRNGGLTDWEVEEAARVAAREAEEAKHAAANAWLIEAMSHYPDSSFARDMAKDLARHPLSSFSPRCRDIMRDMFAKLAGRRGSNANNEACDKFDNLADPG